MNIQTLGVKIGKKIIQIISQQIINYTTSEQFQKRVSEMLDGVVDKIVKAVLSENKSS
ncbi:hypothetical protein [Lactococcus lactis]|uniref:Uncharacterized protein n=1 Tax=Lactococcus lactis TaxID=1358 RepID=A0AAW7IVK9_9LACT|nr:hypothetical protein [Lactococcus lactis]KST82115.1 hypothetical protein ATCC19435_1521 [Lactococcus lactis subsp. lactis]MBU3885767.1 hypothetical protein [Lactococcus lactis]MDM7546937.1 hypothetical protein [Lactococcus lactis]MDX6023998.1 hypothetical protein [Lactococcus lactis subsp. lactis]QPT50788.1 hypothetical protein I6G22_08975 [Lactococcus lactis]